MTVYLLVRTRRHVAEVAHDGVVHEAELVGEARREFGVLHRRRVLPQPEPPAVAFARAALRRRRPVGVGEAGLELAARVARQQHDRVAASRVVSSGIMLARRRRCAVAEEDEAGEGEE